jgi:predicted sulfurtransferase
MNNEQYTDLLNQTKNIRKFNEMVSSEKMQGTAKKVLMYVTGITDKEANEFIAELYSRMDIQIKQPKILFNDLQLKSN